ncbi:MAG: glycosyltransferase family 9 protein [Candidatus Eiseniibacteriota bacterium]|nr:MAG: glycosyltransferase family 9 protein [Candidatus Eisenbacteria bacterium]
MGDMLLATPCLRALRESLPASRITLLASHENEAVVRNNPHVNEVLVYDKRSFRSNPLALSRFLKELRRRDFYICVVLSTVSLSLTSVLLCLLSGARYRLSYSGNSFGMGFVDRAFHVAIPVPHAPLHQTRLGLNLLEHFGISTQDLSPVMRPDEEDELFAERFMSEAGVRAGDSLVAIHPGAGKRKNRWSSSGFAGVANGLRDRKGVRVLMMSGPSDEEVLDAVLEQLEFKPVLLSAVSIGRVAAVMKKLSLFVCNDTGVLHVAASVGCPTLALFGPTDPSWWTPMADCVNTLKAPGPGMEGLTQESVLAAAVELISGRHNGTIR